MYREKFGYFVCTSLIFGLMLHRNYFNRHPEEIRTLGRNPFQLLSDIVWKKLFSFGKYGIYRKVGTFREYKKSRGEN